MVSIMSDTIMMSEVTLRAAAKITLCRKITRLARANHRSWDKMTKSLLIFPLAIFNRSELPANYLQEIAA
jgi:hypothetical protein